MRGRTITQHILAIEQIAVVVPDLLTSRTLDSLRHVMGQFRFRYEDYDDGEEGDARAYEEHAKNTGDDVLELDGILRLGPVAF